MNADNTEIDDREEVGTEPEPPEATTTAGGNVGFPPRDSDFVEAEKPRSTSKRDRRGALLARLPLVPIAAGLLVAILAGSLVFEMLRINDLQSTSSMRTSALASARTYGVYLSTYDYRTLNKPGSTWAQTREHSTAKFRSKFASTSSLLSKGIVQYDAVSKGKVLSAGLVSLQGNRAVVLLFVSETLTNNFQKPPTVTQDTPLELTLLHQHGQWLIDDLQVPK